MRCAALPQTADVLIAGTGAAGLFCALQLPRKLQVVVVTKERAECSNSYLAQGGIAVLRDPDDYACYFEDTMRAGHYCNDAKAVEVMVRTSPEIIAELTELGVEFTRTAQGFCYTREGAHSTARILHYADETGAEITGKLLRRVRQRENISIYEHTAAVDLLMQEGTCVGLQVCTPQACVPIYARATVLATGGLGGLFGSTTNYRHITGDALAMARRHDVALQDMSRIQIHPTVLYTGKVGRGFLISEALRGEGAVLLDARGARFTDELQPRDVLTDEMLAQMREDGVPFVQLSAMHLGKAFLQQRFPHIYQHCLEQGYDLAEVPVPVAPAQHYFMGGIAVDLNGRTDAAHLYAIGETACNGVHGANRLASNSLLESLVFAKRAAVDLVQHLSPRLPVVTMERSATCEDSIQLQRQVKRCIMEEIKREDGAFYDRWCKESCNG